MAKDRKRRERLGSGPRAPERCGSCGQLTDGEYAQFLFWHENQLALASLAVCPRCFGGVCEDLCWSWASIWGEDPQRRN